MLTSHATVQHVASHIDDKTLVDLINGNDSGKPLYSYERQKRLIIHTVLEALEASKHE